MFSLTSLCLKKKSVCKKEGALASYGFTVLYLLFLRQESRKFISESTIFRAASKPQVLLRLQLGNSHQKKYAHVSSHVREDCWWKSLVDLLESPEEIKLCTEAASIKR